MAGFQARGAAMRDSRPLELPSRSLELSGTEPPGSGCARITRRQFVQTALAVSGLALAVDLAAQERERGAWGRAAGLPPRNPSACSRAGEDDVMTVVSPAVEMGQRRQTSITMIIVDELGGR